MPTHQIGNTVATAYVDKRRASLTPDFTTRTTRGVALFTANGAGTTTTIVGANAAPGTDDTNVIRRGERFRLFTSTGVLKQETVFTVTAIAVAAGTTVTFIPAASANTASGDIARQVGTVDLVSQAALDARLLALGYTQAQIDIMTENDKVYAVRVKDDPAGLNY
jgi:plastocyanin